MARDYRQVVTDVGELVAMLKTAEHHIVALQAQVRALGAEPVTDQLHKRVDTLELSVRSLNSLQNAGIEFIYQLVERTEVEMLKSKHFGRKGVSEIKEVLADLGLWLGMKLGDDFPRTSQQ